MIVNRTDNGHGLEVKSSMSVYAFIDLTKYVYSIFTIKIKKNDPLILTNVLSNAGKFAAKYLRTRRVLRIE